MSGHDFESIAIILSSFAQAFVFTWFLRKFLLKRALLDLPNERSSHKTPVPRGGGWAILAVVLPGMIFTLLGKEDVTSYIGILAGTVILIAVSWYDDRKSASVMMRFSAHIMAACLGSLTFSEQTLFNGLLPFALDRAVMILGWAWFMNLYNFMDGIDGITGVETIAIALGSCLLFSATGLSDSFHSSLILLLIGSCLGFLAFNWHPAKIFLGDVGSVPLGFLTGYLLLSLTVNGHLIPALIISLYYLADSGITIIKRGLRGEKVWQAHRQHFYQHAAAGIGRHDKVVYWVAAANIALIAAAILSVSMPWSGLTTAAAIVAFLLWKMHKAAGTHD